MRVQSGTRRKALAYVVDDSEIACELLTEALTTAGFEVIAIRNAIGLRATLIRDRPDILVLDVSVPPFEGPEIVRLIRSQPTLDYLPIMLISGRPISELATIARSCDADSFMTKDEPAKLATYACALMLRGRIAKRGSS
jgi:DNA-binding response OmpR family regulator